MEFVITQLIDIILHVDQYLAIIIQNYGIWIYVLLFLIIFAETGLVITPFLPGDSLLFALGALAAAGSINLFILLVLLCLAAIIGDTVNYWIGNWSGEKIINNIKIKLIKKEHIEKTEKFYKKYGAKTIIIGRFVPIIRTFAPFTAGVGKMNYHKFLLYNIIGGILWISIFLFAGYFFGNIPLVKNNFTIVIFAIIIISFIPGIVTYIKEKRASSLQKA